MPHRIPVANGFTDHQIATIVVNSAFPALTFFFICLRLYAKQLKNGKWQLDDLLILIGFVFLLGNSAPYIYCVVKGGMGEHVINLTGTQLTVFGLVTFWTQFPYLFAVATIKCSILVFYRNVFSVAKFRLATNFMFGLLAAWTVAFFFASLFQAWPISYNWNENQPGSTINEGAMYNALACTELATDVMILVMPLFVVWGLQMRTSKKWAISGIFLLGGFVCVASAFRIYYFTTTILQVTADFTYDTYGIFIWTAIEPCMGIICACLPCLGPLFKDGRTPRSFINSARSFLRLGSSRGSSGDGFGSGNSKSSLIGANSKKYAAGSKGSYIGKPIPIARDEDGRFLVEKSASPDSRLGTPKSTRGIVVTQTLGNGGADGKGMGKGGIMVTHTIVSEEARRSRGW